MGHTNETSKLPGVQIARAIAASSIVYFHSWTILDRFPKGTAHPIPLLSEYGWLGVDLFFAISGYVICLIVAKPNFSPVNFMTRRFFRIYPLWLVTLTAFAVLAWAWRGFQQRETLDWLIYSATLLPTNGFPFYDIGWSLQHEMLFYVVACIIAPMFGLWGLALVLSISTVLVHLLPLPWFPGNFMMYHAEFLAGVLAFLVNGRCRLGVVLPLMIGCASFYFVLFVSGGRPFVPIPLFFLVVGFANISSHRALQLPIAVGDASYSMYLLHPLVFLIAKAATVRFAAVTWTEEPMRFSSMGIVAVVALLSWRFFEKPAIALGDVFAGRRPKSNYQSGGYSWLGKPDPADYAADQCEERCSGR